VHWKLTVTGVLFQPAAFGAGALEAITLSGGNGWKLNWMLVVPVLPAISVALPLMVCRPAVVTVTGEGQMATPDKLSLQVNATVAETAVTNPFASGSGETAAVTVGGVLSRLTETLVLAVCAEASVTVPLIVWLARSTDTICAAGHCSGGTPPAHWNETVTSELFHPAALGAGAAVAVIASAVCCTLNVRLVDAVLPALSVAVPLNFWFAPAVVTLMFVGQLAVPESASVQVKDTEAGRVTTPFTAAGVTVSVMPGLVLSIFSVTETEAWLPFASVAVAETT
jgi:hypothetical protein